MLFLGQSVEKTQATGCFHRFLLFAYKRNAVFPIFCISLASESQFSLFFVRRLQAKRCFSRFLPFARERRTITLFFLLFYASTTPFLSLMPHISYEHATERGTEWTALFE